MNRWKYRQMNKHTKERQIDGWMENKCVDAQTD